MQPMTLSGSDRLTKIISLLYELLNKEVQPSVIADIVAFDETRAVRGMNVILINGHLAEYAKELAERLVPFEPHQFIDNLIEPRVNADGTLDEWWLKTPLTIKDYAIVPREKYEALLKRVEELEKEKA